MRATQLNVGQHDREPRDTVLCLKGVSTKQGFPHHNSPVCLPAVLEQHTELYATETLPSPLDGVSLKDPVIHNRTLVCVSAISYSYIHDEGR